MRKSQRGGELLPAETAHLPSGCELRWWARNRIRGLWEKRGAKTGSDWRGGAASELLLTHCRCVPQRQSKYQPALHMLVLRLPAISRHSLPSSELAPLARPQICPRASCPLQLSSSVLCAHTRQAGQPWTPEALWPADQLTGHSRHMETPAIRAPCSVILCLFHLSAPTMCWSRACKQIVRPRFALVLSSYLFIDNLLLFSSPAEQARPNKHSEIDEPLRYSELRLTRPLPLHALDCVCFPCICLV